MPQQYGKRPKPKVVVQRSIGSSVPLGAFRVDPPDAMVVSQRNSATKISICGSRRLTPSKTRLDRAAVLILVLNVKLEVCYTDRSSQSLVELEEALYRPKREFIARLASGGIWP